jgi:hypothetical protein
LAAVKGVSPCVTMCLTIAPPPQGKISDPRCAAHAFDDLLWFFSHQHSVVEEASARRLAAHSGPASSSAQILTGKSRSHCALSLPIPVPDSSAESPSQLLPVAGQRVPVVDPAGLSELVGNGPEDLQQGRPTLQCLSYAPSNNALSACTALPAEESYKKLRTS